MSNKELDLLLTLAECMGIKEPTRLPFDELAQYMQSTIETLVDEDESHATAIKHDLNEVSAYYRRRVVAIRKLANQAKTMPHRIEQIINNCDEMLKGGEDSVRQYTDMVEA
jgi:predicted DNA-binding ArsR family transcriptional regulator